MARGKKVKLDLNRVDHFNQVKRRFIFNKIDEIILGVFIFLCGFFIPIGLGDLNCAIMNRSKFWYNAMISTSNPAGGICSGFIDTWEYGIILLLICVLVCVFCYMLFSIIKEWLKYNWEKSKREVEEELNS